MRCGGSRMRILGIDLGFSKSMTAFAVLDDAKLIAAGHVSFDKGHPFEQKLHTIVKNIEYIAEHSKIDAIIIENHTIRGKGGDKFKMIIGALVYPLSKYEIGLFNPMKIKMIIAKSGKADKIMI